MAWDAESRSEDPWFCTWNKDHQLFLFKKCLYVHYLAATGSGIKTLWQYFILFNAAVLSVWGQICPALFWTIISHPGWALQDLAYLSFSQRLLQLGRNAEGTLLNSNTLKEHKLIGRKSENLFTRTQPFSSLARLSPFQCWTLYNPHFDVIWS